MGRRETPDVLADIGAVDGGDSVAMAMGPQAQRVATVLIRLDGGTQPRAGIDQAVVDDYYQDMANGDQFPPVELVYDGEVYWLWDGFHRFHAWRRDGDRAIPANVRQGTRRDAVLLSVGANATHGFRRSSEDKRRAVDTLLRDPEWSQWSNREIGRRVAVDDKTVAARRTALSAEIPQMEARRVERNGTEYTMTSAQRPAEAAVGAQGGLVMGLAQLKGKLREWSAQYEDGAEALRGVYAEQRVGSGSYLEDWTEWVGGRWSKSDFYMAAADLLREEHGYDMTRRPAPQVSILEPPANGFDTAQPVRIAEQGDGLRIEFQRSKTHHGGRQLTIMARNGVKEMGVRMYSWFDNVHILSPGMDMSRAEALALMDAIMQAIAEIKEINHA